MSASDLLSYKMYIHLNVFGMLKLNILSYKYTALTYNPYFLLYQKKPIFSHSTTLGTILEQIATMDFLIVPELATMGWNILAKINRISRAKTSADSSIDN
jgi:hypothetical protein